MKAENIVTLLLIEHILKKNERERAKNQIRK